MDNVKGIELAFKNNIVTLQKHVRFFFNQIGHKTIIVIFFFTNNLSVEILFF